jgi:hypothetical protein
MVNGETMKRRFNDTGVCIPEKHYMVDISGKVARIFPMIEQGDYFVINRPNQYGKTTTIYMLNKFLKTSPEYFPVQMSFEGFGAESYRTEAAFIEAFILQLKRLFKISGDEHLVKFIDSGSPVDHINKLDIWFTNLVMKIGKKVVLMIEREFSYNRDNPVIRFGSLYGILGEKEAKTKIHNRLYEQRIYNYIILTGKINPGGTC